MTPSPVAMASTLDFSDTPHPTLTTSTEPSSISSSPISQQLPHSRRPQMLARDAEGVQNDGALEQLVSFLRDTAPEPGPKPQPSRDSILSLPSRPTRMSSQSNLLRRAFKTSSKTKSVVEPFDTVTPRPLKTANAVERVTPSGHKYIQITPVDCTLPSLTALDEEDALAAMMTSEEATQPWQPSADVADASSRPKTAGAVPTKGVVPVKSFISQLETDMQRRWHNATSSSKPQQTLRSARTAEELKAPRASETSKRSPTLSRPTTPPDSDISAIIRATAGPPKYRTRPPTPSQALASHPTEPPGPAPRGPLPDPPQRPLSIISSRPSLVGPAYDQDKDNYSLSHPLFRYSAELLDKPTTPSERSMSLSLLALHNDHEQTGMPSLSNNSEDQAQAGEYDPFMSPNHLPRSAPKRPSTGNTLRSTSDFSTFPKRPTTSGTMQSISGFSSFSARTDTPGSREERTRMRKLRHLKTGKSNPLSLRNGTDGEALEEEEHQVDAGVFSISMIMTTIDQRPLAPGSPTDLRDEIKPLSSLSAQRQSPSQQQHLATLPTTNLIQTSSLLPEIRLLPARQSNSTRLSSATAPEVVRDSCGFGFPLPNRTSYMSQPEESSNNNQTHTAHSHVDRAMSMTSQSSSACGLEGTQSSSRSRTSNSGGDTTTITANNSTSTRSSRAALHSQIAHLERQNNLLEAALTVVLRTGGLLNGCPCQAEQYMSRFDASQRGSTSYAPLSGASSATTRESVLVEAAAAAQAQVHMAEATRRKRESVATSSSVTSKASRRISANTGASRESGGRIGGKKESRALALYMVTRLDLGAKKRASSRNSEDAEEEDMDKTLTESWVA